MRRGHVLVAEVLRDRGEVRACLEAGIREKRLRLGGERDAVSVEPVVERLLAQAIARDEEAPFLRVPDREREHAAQLLEARGDRTLRTPPG